MPVLRIPATAEELAAWRAASGGGPRTLAPWARGVLNARVAQPAGPAPRRLEPVALLGIEPLAEVEHAAKLPPRKVLNAAAERDQQIRDLAAALRTVTKRSVSIPKGGGR